MFTHKACSCCVTLIVTLVSNRSRLYVMGTMSYRLTTPRTTTYYEVLVCVWNTHWRVHMYNFTVIHQYETSTCSIPGSFETILHTSPCMCAQQRLSSVVYCWYHTLPLALVTRCNSITLLKRPSGQPLNTMSEQMHTSRCSTYCLVIPVFNWDTGPCCTWLD